MRILWRVMVKEFLQLRRDRKMIPMLVMAPLIQLLVFGFAANLDVSDIPLLVIDRDHSAASRELVERFTSSGHFQLAGTAPDVGAVEAWLVDGSAQVALVVGEHYGADLAAGRVPNVQVIADGTDANSAVVGLGYASRIIGSVGLQLVEQRAAAASAAAGLAHRAVRQVAAGRIELVPRIWYNPDLLSRWFFLPAILAMVLMMVTMILPSMAVVREKEIGTLEQLIVTPIRSWQLILGKLVPYAVLGLLDLLLVIGFVTLFFKVPLAGSLVTLVVLSLPFLVTMLAMGLLVSTLAANQQQAMMVAMLLVMVPMIYLSGLIFPIENMPAPMQVVTWAIPLRYYTNIIRGVFLKGSGFAVLARDALAMTGFALLFLVLAARRFRKTLE